MTSGSDERIANLRRVRDLLQQAEQQVQMLLQQERLGDTACGQDNRPDENAQTRSPSV